MALTFYLLLNNPKEGNSFSIMAINGSPKISGGILHKGITIPFPKDQRCVDHLVKRGWDLESDKPQEVVFHYQVNLPSPYHINPTRREADGTITLKSHHTYSGHNVISDSRLDWFGICNQQFFGAYNTMADKGKYPPLELQIFKSEVHPNTLFGLGLN